MPVNKNLLPREMPTMPVLGEGSCFPGAQTFAFRPNSISTEKRWEEGGEA